MFNYWQREKSYKKLSFEMRGKKRLKEAKKNFTKAANDVDNRFFNNEINHENHLTGDVTCAYSKHEKKAITQSLLNEENLNEVTEESSLEINSAKNKNGDCKKYYEQLKAERKHLCKICRKSFITLSHLTTHMYCHSDKKWKCDGCGKNYSCERSLVRHKDTFPGEHRFPCKLCGLHFFRIVNLIKHLEIKHPEASNGIRQVDLPALTSKENENETTNKSEKLFICTKLFGSWENLQAHEKELNSECSSQKDNNKTTATRIPNYKCDLCGKGFVSSEGFEYHKSNSHSEKKLKKRKKLLAVREGEEKNEELGETNFMCKICFISFPSKGMLHVHLKNHNTARNIEVKSGPYSCCICPRTFASSDGLKYHLATHTGERRFSCGQCEKKFIKKSHLFEHIATHSRAKYFKCLQCPRTFRTHSAYRKHIKHFPGPHSFPCTKCGKLFTKESMIEKHMCVDLVKVTMAPEVKALLSVDGTEDKCMEEREITESDKNYNVDMIKVDKVEVENAERSKDTFCEDVTGENSESASHSCYKCFKVFPTLQNLQTHQLEHIGKQDYQCRFCPEHFKRADEFGTHIRSHLGSTPYMCLKCNRKFISPLTLSMHAKKYPGDHSFTCEKCQRWFPSEKRLERHECILQSSDVFTCACRKAFKNWNEFVHHAGSKPYKCCSCEFKFPTLIALARHIKRHTGIKPYSCELCGKSFRAKNNYLHHQKVHEDIKEIHCQHCSFKSKSEKRMNFHLFRKHDIGSNTASILCSICGIICQHLTQMKKHMEIEHGNELILNETKEKKGVVLCTLCGKLLSNKYMLTNHMKKVHDPNASAVNQELIKCNVCNETFKSKKRLQTHAEIHESSILRNCEFCNKQFYFAKDLRKHLRQHDTNKPYSCGKCGKHFKVSVSLKYHSSICGDFNMQTDNGKHKKEKFSTVNVLESFDLKNSSYTLVYTKLNP